MESSDPYGHSVASPLARLAARQHGVVGLGQLEALGYTRRWIYRRARQGHLHRIHLAVYAVGHTRLTVKGQWMAAVLACGPEALLSHHAAAALHDLRPIPQTRVDVTAAGHRHHDGVRCHVSDPPPPERTRIDAIPCTTLERTLLDYAEMASPRQLNAALEAAQRRDLLDDRRLRATIDRNPGRRGLAALRAAIGALTDEPPWLQSELERRFRDLTHQAGLPPPSHNVTVAGHVVDVAWPRHKLVVELDGYEFHRTRTSFEEDRRRDAELQIAGWRVLRITHRRLADQAGVLADLRLMLATG